MSNRVHRYHAEATAIAGHLRLPLVQEIKPQAHVKLPCEGGYISQRAEDYKLEAVISFRSAYTHVAGNSSEKQEEGFTTLVTTAIDGLNVMDVLTADRVVGQMITDHPLDGYVPRISFLGTRFENLRIAGHLVEVDFNHDIIGPKPANDAPYTSETSFLGRVSRQYEVIREQKHLPEALAERYNRLSSTLGSREAVECSLVNQAAGRFPGHSFGHVITIPHFGTITLGKLTLKHEDHHEQTGVPKKTTVHLTMIDLALGCAVCGNVPVGDGNSNGGPT